VAFPPPADVHVYLGDFPDQFASPFRVPSEREGPVMSTKSSGEGSYFELIYPEGTGFLIDAHGSQVWAQWPSHLSLEDLAAYLLGPISGLVLRLRGTVCLHGSAIAIGERAIAFVGPNGVGKSTLAAAFAELGYGILSDDVVPLIKNGQGCLAQPGYPRLRLWPDSVAALYGSAEALPRWSPTWDKRYLDLSTPRYRFQSSALPLAAVYVVDEPSNGERHQLVESICGSAAVMALIANTYMNRLLDAEMRKSEFEFLTALLPHVPVRRVSAPVDFAALRVLCGIVDDDFSLLMRNNTRAAAAAI